MATEDSVLLTIQTYKRSQATLLPQAKAVSVMSNDWKIYRTRFLIQARQLTAPLMFVDILGRQHHGEAGDYLVETAEGVQSIASREIFEDIYVAMGRVEGKNTQPAQRGFIPNSELPAGSLRTTAS